MEFEYKTGPTVTESWNNINMVDKTWRLSRIQEELENLDFPLPPPPITSTHSLDRRRTSSRKEVSPPGPHGGSLRRQNDPSYRPEQEQHRPGVTTAAVVDTDKGPGIYDKVALRTEWNRKPSIEDEANEAVKKITEKYDSLGRNGMGLLKAYSESQQHRSKSCDSVLDRPEVTTEFHRPAVNSELLTTDGYRQDTVDSSIAPASIGADPSFPPPTTQDELTNASGIVTKLSGRLVSKSSNMSPMLRRLPTSEPPVTTPTSLRLEERGGLLTEVEVLQVEMFYRSHKSEVWVSQSTAHLHLGSVKITTSLTPEISDKKMKHSQHHQHQPIVSSELVENWKYIKMGVPVLLLDSGASRRDRKLYILLAEKGTGFTLWRDEMDHLSGYKSSTSVFHTMHLSGDHNKMAGFAFDDAHAAAEFLARWKAIASDPDDDILILSGKNKKRKKEEKKQKGKFNPPNKSAISTPCCFTHVTKLDRTDGMNILGTKGPRSATRDLKQLSSPVKMSRVSSLIPHETHKQ